MEGARAAVLVVDDDDELREWLTVELSRAGFSVEKAASGQEAIAIASRQRFDVALIDLRMPRMDGLATLAALKERDPDLEAVMASGQGTIPDAVASLKQGAFDFIQKPYTLRELVPVLDRALEKSHLQGVVALHAASNALMTLHGEQELLSRACDIVQRLFRVSAFGLVLLRPAPEVVTLQVSSDGTLPAAPPDLVLALAARASAEGDLRLRAVGSSLGKFTSAIAARLLVPGNEIGGLVLLRDESLPIFTDEERRRAIVFAGQLALALDNARLHAEVLARIDEITRTRDALVFSEKLAMAGQLAAGVAHEIKNPLAFVLWNLDYILDTTTRSPDERETESAPPLEAETMDELRKAAAEAREGVLRIRGIAADLTELAQPQDDVRVKLNLRKVVDWAANMSMPQIRPRARLVREYQDVRDVIGSEARLGQVFVNLLVNAAQAIPAEHPSRHQITVRLFESGSNVIAEVQDTGSGIPEAEMGRLFEPFFTTKQPGTGTGLGLTISRGIVETHGGRITAESTPGQGTTFRVTLPAVA